MLLVKVSNCHEIAKVHFLDGKGIKRILFLQIKKNNQYLATYLSALFSYFGFLRNLICERSTLLYKTALQSGLFEKIASNASYIILLYNL